MTLCHAILYCNTALWYTVACTQITDLRSLLPWRLFRVRYDGFMFQGVLSYYTVM